MMRKTRRMMVAAVAGVAVVLAAVFALVSSPGVTAATTLAPTNTVPPTITGTPEVGRILTATHGTWTNAPTTFAYQWRRCDTNGLACTSVALNGKQKTYTLVASDAGHTMRVRVTATNADGSDSARSDQTAVVAPATSAAAPKNTSTPTISGTPKVGQELSANEGTWSGDPTFSYQWQRCDADVASCSNVVGATGRTYGVRLADLGYRLRVAVTARNAKGSASANSAITAVVAPTVTIRNSRPTIGIVSIRFSGATVYARFRICDDSYKNLTILATDSRPRVAPYTRRFTTLVAPRPCGVYTRHWLPAARFRGHGKYTVTLRARDKSGLTSLPARRTFSR